MCSRQLSLVLSVLLVFGGVFVSPAEAQSPDTSDTTLRAALTTVDSLRRVGNFRAAQKQLQALREKHPSEGAVLWRLAYTYADLGQTTDDEDQRADHYENAIEVAKAGLAADSTSARAHLALAVAQGRAALNSGTRERIQRSRAIKRHADRAVALDSTLDGAYHTRGRWHREVEDIGFFQRAMVKTVYGGLPESSIEQAVRDFQRAIELNDEVFHRLELAKTYVQMDRPEAARRELETAIDMPGADSFAPKYKKEARTLLDELD